MGTGFRNAIAAALLLVIGWALYNGYFLGSEAPGVLFFYIVAVFFSVIAARWAKAWWAMMPAGFAASYAVVVAAEGLIPHQSFPVPPGSTITWGVFMWVVFAGFAATFGAMWLWRRSRPTDWAKYPAVGLLALSIATLILGAHFQEVWLQTILLVTGATIVLALVTRKRLPAGQPPRPA